MTTQLSYAQELEQQLDGLIEWAVANQPHTIDRITSVDFHPVREQFLTLAKSGNKLSTEKPDAPEPAEGGPQYINDNPAPWP